MGRKDSLASHLDSQILYLEKWNIQVYYISYDCMWYKKLNHILNSNKI
jgi:hypothetical protein